MACETCCGLTGLVCRRLPRLVCGHLRFLFLSRRAQVVGSGARRTCATCRIGCARRRGHLARGAALRCWHRSRRCVSRRRFSRVGLQGGTLTRLGHARGRRGSADSVARRRRRPNPHGEGHHSNSCSGQRHGPREPAAPRLRTPWRRRTRVSNCDARDSSRESLAPDAPGHMGLDLLERDGVEATVKPRSRRLRVETRRGHGRRLRRHSGPTQPRVDLGVMDGSGHECLLS